MAGENVLDTRPKGKIVAVFTPPWWVEIAAAKNGSILQVHHPEHGWLAFVLPPEHANVLGVTLVKHSALCDYFAGDARTIDSYGELRVWTIMPSRDDDIETMPEDDLLTIPSGNVPPGLLTVLGFIAKIGLLRPEDDLGGSDLRR